MASPCELHCPSTQPNLPGTVIHGVVDAASGRIAYLDTPQPATPELLASTAPLLPTEVLRLSGPCQEKACGHFTGSRCSLVDRLVQILPASPTKPERCPIRSTCRWFSEHSFEACARCSLIVTDSFARAPELLSLSTPQP